VLLWGCGFILNWVRRKSGRFRRQCLRENAH
jgi:hypothetical protein